MDLSQYSDAELEAMLGQAEQPDLSGYSDAELEAMLPPEQRGVESPQQGTFAQEQLKNLQALQGGVADAATMGWWDEGKAALQARIRSKLVGDVNYQQAYDAFLNKNRAEAQQLQSENPYAYGTGQFTGAVGSTMLLPAGVTKYAASGLLPAIGTSAGIGAISGGLYGAGSSEGTPQERLQAAGTGAVYGSLGGVAGAGVAKGLGSLAQRAKDLISKKASMSVKIPPSVSGNANQTLNNLVQTTQDAQQLTYGQAVNSKALNQVTSALKADYPDNYEQILSVWQESDQPLAQIAGAALTRKAMGAAQYETALPKTVKYFTEATSEAKDKLIQSVNKNIGDSKSYFATVDDILEKGRKKAAPLYDKAYTKEIDPSFTFKPEIKTAIESAKKRYPSELEGLSDSSIKVLDYAKKELDDQIGVAKRAGENNFVRNRTELKDELLSAMDSASPDYAQGRAIAGDYLGITEAMENGQKFVSLDPENITNILKTASDSEKQAFKVGFSKAIASRIDNVNEGANPYNRVFGSPSKQAQLRAALTPDEYKKLEIDMKATNRLFDMKNKVLGNSSTVSKGMAAAEISDADLMQMITQPKKSAMNWLKNNLTSGGKTASSIADLLYETDPTKKLLILERVSGNKELTKAEKQIVMEQYFNLENRLKVVGSGVGGQAATPTATIRARDYQEQK